jgi:hypothetical protein
MGDSSESTPFGDARARIGGLGFAETGATRVDRE